MWYFILGDIMGFCFGLLVASLMAAAKKAGAVKLGEKE